MTCTVYLMHGLKWGRNKRTFLLRSTETLTVWHGTKITQNNAEQKETFIILLKIIFKHAHMTVNKKTFLQIGKKKIFGFKFNVNPFICTLIA